MAGVAPAVPNPYALVELPVQPYLPLVGPKSGHVSLFFKKAKFLDIKSLFIKFPSTKIIPLIERNK